MQLFIDSKLKVNVAFEKRPEVVYAVDLTRDGEVFPRYLHMHKDILELVFVAEGRGRHLIGEHSYETVQGDIMIFNAGVGHDEARDGEEILKSYCVGISNFKIYGLEENQLIPDHYEQVLRTGEKEMQIRRLYQLILEQLDEPQTNGRQICNVLAEAMIYTVFQLPLTKLRYELEQYESTKKIRKFLDEHYAEVISLDEIAAELKVTTYYLSHMFRNQTGFSPKQYVIRRRIGKAQTLLINTDYTVTRIATMVGYDNTNYFNTLFSKMVGVSPQRYRKIWIMNQNAQRKNE